MRTVRLVAGDVVLIPRLHVCTGVFDRMRGLLGRRGLAAGEGMLLSPCRAIHTWFMRFTIDVFFLDASWTVVEVRRGVRPFRMAGAGLRARHAVEVESGWVPGGVLTPRTAVFFDPPLDRAIVTRTRVD